MVSSADGETAALFFNVVSSEPASDLAEKRMKARWSKSLEEYQSSVVDTGDDAGDLMLTASFPSSSADPCASAVSLAIDSSLQPQSRFLSKGIKHQSVILIALLSVALCIILVIIFEFHQLCEMDCVIIMFPLLFIL